MKTYLKLSLTVMAALSIAACSSTADTPPADYSAAPPPPPMGTATTSPVTNEALPPLQPGM